MVQLANGNLRFALGRYDCPKLFCCCRISSLVTYNHQVYTKSHVVVHIVHASCPSISYTCQCCCCRYVKFDTFHPAVDRGLPVTRVISRVVLQQLLAETAISMAGEDVILNDQNVVDYQHEASHHHSTTHAQHDTVLVIQRVAYQLRIHYVSTVLSDCLPERQLCQVNRSSVALWYISGLQCEMLH